MGVVDLIIVATLVLAFVAAGLILFRGPKD
jgi:hypothetical protein